MAVDRMRCSVLQCVEVMMWHLIKCAADCVAVDGVCRNVQCVVVMIWQ